MDSNKNKNTNTEVTIGSRKYISLCKNCVFGKDVSFIRSPKSNADVETDIPTYDQYYCSKVRTDLVYLKHGEDEVLLDVAECDSYEPLNTQIKQSKKSSIKDYIDKHPKQKK